MFFQLLLSDLEFSADLSALILVFIILSLWDARLAQTGSHDDNMAASESGVRSLKGRQLDDKRVEAAFSSK